MRLTLFLYHNKIYDLKIESFFNNNYYYYITVVVIKNQNKIRDIIIRFNIYRWIELPKQNMMCLHIGCLVTRGSPYLNIFCSLIIFYNNHIY